MTMGQQENLIMYCMWRMPMLGWESKFWLCFYAGSTNKEINAGGKDSLRKDCPFNLYALRMTKTKWSLGHSECSGVKNKGLLYLPLN